MAVRPFRDHFCDHFKINFARGYLEWKDSCVVPRAEQAETRSAGAIRRIVRQDRRVNGELAELICLATHGTSWLESGASDAPALERSNSTFQFVGSVSFHLAKEGRLSQDEQATDVAEWLRGRRRADVERLSLVVPGIPSAGDQHALAAFANAGHWGLLAHSKKRTEAWRATWTVADRDAPDRRIWAVNYEGTQTAPTAPQHFDLAEAADSLRARLTAIAAFAEQEGLDDWTSWFRKALDGPHEIPYHGDMLPIDYGIEERRVLAMAAQAWVFGGMGSWTDLGFIEVVRQQRYKDLTRELYDAVIRAFVAGVNHPE